MTDDAKLLRRYVELHSEADFTAFVERHVDVVYHAALRRTGGRSDLARDATQYVFIALARDVGRLSRHEAIAGWLHTTTRHAVLRIVRAERRRQRHEEEAQIMNSANSEPVGEPDSAWQKVREQLDSIMDELRAHDREAILLRFFHDRPFAEIGAAFGSSEEAARKRVERAVEALRRRLKRRGVTSTATALATMLSAQAGLAAPAGVAQSVASGALAVAGAGTMGAAGAVGIFIMSTSKVVTGISAVVALAAISTAVYQKNVSRDSSTALAAVAAERDTLRARVAATEQRAKQSDATLAAAQKKLEELRTAATKPEANAPAPPPAVSSAGTVDYVLSHPETHAAFVERQVLSAKTRYDRFLKGAGLSAAQQEEFFKQIRARTEGELDFILVLHSQGYSTGNLPTDPQVQASLQKVAGEQRRQFEEGLRAVLGDEHYKGFQQYSAAIPERNVVDQVGGLLYLSETPLTAQQAEQLTQVLMQTRYSGQPTASPTTTLNGTLLTRQAFVARMTQQRDQLPSLDWPAPVTDAAIARAENLLTPPQLTALRQVQAQQLAQFQIAPPAPASSPVASKLGVGK